MLTFRRLVKVSWTFVWRFQLGLFIWLVPVFLATAIVANQLFPDSGAHDVFFRNLLVGLMISVLILSILTSSIRATMHTRFSDFAIRVIRNGRDDCDLKRSELIRVGLVTLLFGFAVEASLLYLGDANVLMTAIAMLSVPAAAYVMLKMNYGGFRFRLVPLP